MLISTETALPFLLLDNDSLLQNVFVVWNIWLIQSKNFVSGSRVNTDILHLCEKDAAETSLIDVSQLQAWQIVHVDVV
jgi:hypothetical protein